MKKKATLLMVLVLILLLSGCTGIDDQIIQKSGIEQDGNYKQYQELLFDNKLDAEGCYPIDLEEMEAIQEDIPADAIRVTFSKNNQLSVQYFSDPEYKNEIADDAIILKNGDRIYATVKLGREIVSSAYEFSGFRLYEVDKASGKFYLTDTIIPAEDGLIFEWNEQQVGQEFSVAPIGSYLPRTIALKSTYLDIEGKEHDLYGNRWKVNNEQIEGNTAEVSAISPYDVSFEYDKQQYFFVASEPNNISGEEGKVVFDRRDPKDETQDYFVQLSEYLTFTIETQEKRTVWVNDEEKHCNQNDPLILSHLKYKDLITIHTDSKWDELEDLEQLVCKQAGRRVGTEWEYILEVPHQGNEFKFDPDEYQYEHGAIAFYYNGSRITGTKYLEEGRVITYAAVSADNGYWLPDGEHKIEITTSEETRTQLEAIRFEESHLVQVKLPQPQYGGRIDYYIGTAKLGEGQAECYAGSEIEMICTPWDGWAGSARETYKVGGEENQTAQFDKKTVDAPFTETDGHKPKLYVSLVSSVGKDTKFSVRAASNLTEENLTYRSETQNISDITETWSTLKDHFKNLFKTGKFGDLVVNKTIGTENDIRLSVSAREGSSGKAIKIQVLKKVKDKTGEDEIKTYMLDQSTNEIDIPIYAGSRQGESTVVYESIIVRVSVVEVETFESPEAPEHGTVKVYNCDQPSVEIKNGELIDKADELTVTIRPDEGYYIASGKNKTDQAYLEKMKVSDYLTKLPKLINDHPFEKYIRVTLDGEDAYGTCEYIYNGKTVSGTVNVKSGEEIKLKYTVAEQGYRIASSEGPLKFVKNLLTNDKETTQTIMIDESFDGKTLNREIFGIDVEEEA